MCLTLALGAALMASGLHAQGDSSPMRRAFVEMKKRAAACVKSGRAKGKYTSPGHLVRARSELARSGAASREAWGQLSAEWCLTPLSASGITSLTANSESSDAEISEIAIYYAAESNHYYAIADYTWRNLDYVHDEWPELGINDAVGGRDGFGISIGGPLTYENLSAAAAIWGNPLLNDCAWDYGAVELSQEEYGNHAQIDGIETGRGVFYRWQDNTRLAARAFECDHEEFDGLFPWWQNRNGIEVDYDSYGGSVALQFDIVEDGCRQEQAVAEYRHTWSEITISDIVSVTLGPLGISLQVTNEDNSWPRKLWTEPGVAMCENLERGQVNPIGYVVIPPDGSESGGMVSVAEPAMVYDRGDGTMKIHRWYSTGSSFPRLSDYQSGSFHLSQVGDRVASGDVDGDGDDDLVMAYQNSDGTFGFHVFESGIRWDGIWYTSGQFNLDTVGGRLVVDDFDGDGRAEPALARDNGTTMTIYRWRSTGSSFVRAADYQSGSFDLANVGDRVASGDVDGDGRADIVMAYQLGDGTFGFYVFDEGAASSGRWYTSGPFNLDPVAGRLVVGDFTGDGRAEPALVRDNGNGTMKISRWSSTGSAFARIADYASGSFSLSNVGNRVASGDVDGDDRADIVVSYQNGDGTHALHVFPSGASWAGIWYTGGQYDLGNVEGRLAVGRW